MSEVIEIVEKRLQWSDAYLLVDLKLAVPICGDRGEMPMPSRAWLIALTPRGNASPAATATRSCDLALHPISVVM